MVVKSCCRSSAISAVVLAVLAPISYFSVLVLYWFVCRVVLGKVLKWFLDCLDFLIAAAMLVHLTIAPINMGGFGILRGSQMFLWFSSATVGLHMHRLLVSGAAVFVLCPVVAFAGCWFASYYGVFISGDSRSEKCFQGLSCCGFCWCVPWILIELIFLLWKLFVFVKH